MLGNNKTNIGFDSNIFTNNNENKFSPSALIWKRNIIANGGTIPDATLQIFDTNFFILARNNGNILNQLDRLNIYCGLVGYEIAARTNIINSNFYISPVSSPTFDNNGYKSSGTSYLNTNYTPSVNGVLFTLNNNSTFSVVKNPSFSSTYRIYGSSAATKRNDLVRDNTPEFVAFNNSNTPSIETNIITSGNVFLAAKRTNSLISDAIINGSTTNTINTSIALATDTDYELTSNGGGGTPDGNYDFNYHLASGRGSGNLDLINLRIILDNLFAALGV
jgi:hypothetical protein